MRHINLQTITSYPDINNILVRLCESITNILSNNLIGIYLSGSLSYGDFNYDCSDIDLVVVVNQSLNSNEIDSIKLLHTSVGECYPRWRDRLECAYLPANMLQNILPPVEPRPYFGGGIFYDQAPYGNEWIINNYLLYEHGIALSGPDFKELSKPIIMIEVQKACIRDLFQEWEPKINDYEWLENSHYQSYLVMNLCRILYTVMCGCAGTKKEAAQWVKDQFGTSWSHLITNAESWQYGKEFSMQKETIAFIQFVIEKIKHTQLYLEEYDE